MIEEIIKQANVEDKKLLIHYRKNNGDVSERIIGNIAPSVQFGKGYIEAFCYKQNDKRTFKLDRIVDAKIIDDSDFIPAKLVNAPLITVTPQPHASKVDNVTNNHSSQADSSAADPKLSQLCKYYLSCLALENANSVGVPMLVNEEDPQFIEINTPFINGICKDELTGFITSNTRQRKTALVGYPVMIFDNKVIPLLLFQVNADYGIVDMSNTPFVNKAIVNLFISDSDEQMQELLFLEEQLGLNNDNNIIDINTAAKSLKNLRPIWGWKEDPDPESIDISESISLKKENGIYNRCVLLQTDLGNYTMGLEMELNELSKLSEKDYRGSALHQWLYGEIEKANLDSIQNEEILEVLSVNTEQDDAIRHAINAPLSIVTGPPGTGKSQVVANLIVNMAFKGKNAVFSSKNNKAVDVVEQRTNALGERPIMLRLGGNRDFNIIADYLKKLLHAPRPTNSQKQEFDNAKQQYEKLLSDKECIIKQKQIVIQACNQLTRMQEEIAEIKERWRGWQNICNAKTGKNFACKLETLTCAWNACQKEQQSFWIRLFWSVIKRGRQQNFEECLASYNSLLSDIKRQELEADNFDENTVMDQETALQEYRKLIEYKKALDKYDKYHANSTLEELDKQLYDNKRRLSLAAKSLWNKWLITCAKQIPDTCRLQIASFLAKLELNKGEMDSDLTIEYKKIEHLLTQLMPICAVTSLSARGRLPFMAGCYDLVIIDEASQCDIASIIPLLYRAKRTVIIGDPYQLKHITTMSHQQDNELVTKHHVDALWSYCVHSLFDLAVVVGHQSDLIHLRDHHRSHGDIIGFSNKEFYNDLLRVATNYERLIFPYGPDKSVIWKNVVGNTIRPQSGSAYNQEEIDAILEQLRILINHNYIGSIGVVTPFKRQADLITQYLKERHKLLFEELINKHDFIAATAHKFQGDERDVIIFSPVVSNGSTQGTLNFLGSTPNLFNVAITRARACLIVVGNLGFCQESTVHYLSSFAYYVASLNARENSNSIIPQQLGRTYPNINTTDYISEWEMKLYTALYDKGIETNPQYAVDKYHIDLALFINNRKLAIEVGDNFEYNSEQAYSIHLRNMRLFELGWEVIRFMPFQIEDDLEWCVNRIVLARDFFE